MQGNKRVYPREKIQGGKLHYVLLIVSALVLLSGLLGREQSEVSIENITPTQTPIALDESFDETIESRDIQLPSATWIALELGSFDQIDDANALATLYQARGAAGYVWVDERFRILAALYDNRDDASSVREQLRDVHEIETQIFDISLPVTTVRMQGMVGQLDILQAGFIHANDLIAQLQDLSLLIDRQEVSVDQAIDDLLAINAQTSLVAMRIAQRFPKPWHETIEGLVAIFDQFETFASSVSQTASLSEMSTLIKYQAFVTLDQLKQVYDGLY